MADGSSDGSAEKTQASLQRALRCNARCLLLCGSFATLLAAYACLEPVTLLFVPELGWFLLIPSLLLLLLGLVSLGLLSMGNPSKLFQSQLAIFTFLMALLLASAGVFVFHYVAAASHWVFDGCVKYRTEGIWSHNRMRPKLQAAHEEYEQLLCGFKRCRLLNPLTLDLAECGPRARCKGAGSGDRVDSLRFYNWMQHVQVTFHCGGFCQAEVPLFGLTSMKETLEERPACVDAMVELLEIAGKGFGVAALVLALPIALAAIRLACASSDKDQSESSDSERVPLTRRTEAYQDEDDDNL